MGKKRFYHLFSDGFRTDVLFQDAQAFADGMNIVALTALKVELCPVVFSLMDNHTHFVLYCDYEECQSFRDIFMHKYAVWYSNRYSGKLLEPLDFEIKELDDERYLLNTIVYVLRNAIAAGFRFCTEDYPWSSGGLYFRAPGKLEEMTACWRKVSDLSVRERRRLIHSHVELPADWKIAPEGFVWPGNYIDYKIVEQLFKTPKSFTYFMGQGKEDEINRSLGIVHSVAMPDMELRAKAIEHCVRQFHSTNVRGLSVPQRLALAKTLRKEYMCSAKQIARIVHLDPKYIKELL